MIDVTIENLRWLRSGYGKGTRLRLPATPEELQAALKRLDLADGRFEMVITDCRSDIPGLARHLSAYENLDELNYLASLLSGMEPDDRIKFAAAVEHGEYAGSVEDLINLAYNLDCYEYYSGIHNAEDLGRLRAEGRLILPEDCRFYFDYAAYGTDTAINEGGEFTSGGYIYNNRSTFARYYDGKNVPEPRHPEKASIRETLETCQRMVDAVPAHEKGIPAAHDDR